MNISADICAGDKFDSLCRHQIDAPLHDTFVQLHVRNAIHEQTANPVGPLVNSDCVAGAIELGGASETGWARPDNRYFLSCSLLWRIRRYPSLHKPIVNDRALKRLDAYRRFINPEHA